MPRKPLKLLLIDNIDSFTWNLAQGFMALGAETKVVRNDEFTLDDAIAYQPSHLVISPGPGTPSNTGISRQVIQAFRGKIPVLGVCLGHQLLAEMNGGTVGLAPTPVHGKPDWVHHTEDGLFQGLPQPLKVGRYHSLTVKSAPPGFRVTGRTKEGLIMSIDKEDELLYGVQFHPESILCPDGMTLMAGFLNFQKPAQATEGML